MVVSQCILIIMIGIFMLVAGVGISARFRIPWLVIPGGFGGFLIIIGILLYILKLC